KLHRDFSDFRAYEPEVVNRIREVIHVNSSYNAFLVANNLEMISSFDLPKEKKEKIRIIDEQSGVNTKQMQSRETLERYKVITSLMKECVPESNVAEKKSATYKIDNILTHRIWG